MVKKTVPVIILILTVLLFVVANGKMPEMGVDSEPRVLKLYISPECRNEQRSLMRSVRVMADANKQWSFDKINFDKKQDTIVLV